MNLKANERGGPFAQHSGGLQSCLPVCGVQERSSKLVEILDHMVLRREYASGADLKSKAHRSPNDSGTGAAPWIQKTTQSGRIDLVVAEFKPHDSTDYSGQIK